MDPTKTTTHIGLCAGYGGIELGLHRAIPNLRSVALCEIEGFAIANLVAKMEAGLMDPAPIWPDLKTFPWRSFRDRVDILTGGYPCQPFSAAGKRAGKDDPRHLWPWIADGIRLLRPRLCFFENVEGHISLGLRDVIEDLGGLGYRTTWGIFSASEVGAPHQRKRVFILAHFIGTGLERLLQDVGTEGREDARGSAAGCGQHRGDVWPSRPGQPQYGWEPPRVVANTDRFNGSASAEGRQHDTEAGHAGEAVEEPDQFRLEEHRLQHAGVPVGSGGGANTEAVCDEGRELDDTCRNGHGESNGVPAGREGAVNAGSSAAVADTSIIDGERWGARSGRRIWSKVDVERAGQAINEGRQTEPALGGDADGTPGGLDYAELCVSCDNRTDELRLLGNGVVPATAERAFRVLMEELRNFPLDEPSTLHQQSNLL